MEQIILQTDRLLLKSITPGLVNQLVKSLSKSELLSYFGFDEDRFLNLISMHERGMETHSISLYFFVIVETKSNRSIGDVGFHTWNAKHRRAELFYNIFHNEFRNQGYMSEALKKVIAFGFQNLNLHRISVMVEKSNTPSVKLIQSNGFTFEGTMREDYVVNGISDDSDCYSLLKPEWLTGVKNNDGII